MRSATVGPNHIAARTLLALLLGAISPFGQIQVAGQDTPSKPQPRITVSKPTMRILQPLHAEGYVDDLAALNQMTSDGVTPDNNAVVLLFRAFGPGDINPALRTRFFEMLKIEPLPEQGEYITGYSQYIDKKYGRSMTTSDSQELDKALTDGSSKNEFPLVAEWLANNQKPLALVVEGAKRAKYYFPLIAPAEASVLELQLPAMSGPRHAAFLLAARTMQWIRQGKVTEAERDILACHRLGRLLGEMPFRTNSITGVAIDEVAFRSDVALMQYGHLSSKDALEYQHRLRDLPPIADKLDAPTRESLDQLGFALVAYRADHRAYPDRLEALAPHCIAQIPDDFFSGQPLIYKPQADGFLLYSVGENGKDDDGRTYRSQPPGDDIAVRIHHRAGTDR